MVILFLKKQMEKKKVKLSEVAAEIGESYAVMNNLITRKNDSIRFDIIEKLCDYFDCTPAEIIKIKKEKNTDIQLGNIQLKETIDSFKMYMMTDRCKIYHYKYAKIVTCLIKAISTVIGKYSDDAVYCNIFRNGKYLASCENLNHVLFKSEDAKQSIEASVEFDLDNEALFKDIIDELRTQYGICIGDASFGIRILYAIMECIVYTK